MNRLIFAFVFLVFTSCGSETGETISDGLYTCIHQHAFAKTEDTILLERIRENYFQITRRAAVTVLNDTTAPKQQVTETLKLEYDKNKGTLTELKKGKLILWVAGKRSLIFGNKVYVMI